MARSTVAKFGEYFGQNKFSDRSMEVKLLALFGNNDRATFQWTDWVKRAKQSY